jgi:hypothetical protein
MMLGSRPMSTTLRSTFDGQKYTILDFLIIYKAACIQMSQNILVKLTLRKCSKILRKVKIFTI